MMDALKTAFVETARVVFNGAYQFQCRRQIRRRGPTREKVAVFVSRQMDVPSENFRALGGELEQLGWNVVYHTKRLTKRTLLSYTAHVFREIALLASASAVVLDRYDPVVSLLDFDCEEAGEGVGVPLAKESGTGSVGTGAPEDGVAPCSPSLPLPPSPPLHTEYPVHPVVIQLWHAFGSFKKFGYQSLDTPEGHSSTTARLFRIHRNYSWVICTSEDDRPAFAEAFSVPVERVVPLGLPEFDALVAKRKTGVDEGASQALSTADAAAPRPYRVLFAPTLRKDPTSPHPFHDLEAWWSDHPSSGLEPRWSYHPLERGVGAATDIAFGLEEADVVVTDYSSLVYEAYVLRKPVLFYVPDIEAYRVSPGLNADPGKRCSTLCYKAPCNSWGSL